MRDYPSGSKFPLFAGEARLRASQGLSRDCDCVAKKKHRRDEILWERAEECAPDGGGSCTEHFDGWDLAARQGEVRANVSLATLRDDEIQRNGQFSPRYFLHKQLIAF